MAQTEQELQALSHRLIEMGRSAPPVQSYNRQLLRVVIDAVGAEAATLWLVRQNELILSEEIEQEGGAIQTLEISEDEQQNALRQCFEEGQSVPLRDSAPGVQKSPEQCRAVLFVPVSDIRGVVGVVRLIVPPNPLEVLQKLTQLGELACGYYSLYSAHRLLSIQQEERQEIDQLSKAILQLQHYTFSDQLPEVLVNSAMEIAPLDRVVLLTSKGKGELEVGAVSSVVETDEKGAWTKLVAELGEVVLDRGEPVQYDPAEQNPEDIEDEELRRQLNSYALMTDVKSIILYPLESAHEKAGVLIYERFEQEAPSPFERVLCTVFATHAGSALGNHRLFDSLPLSGFYSKKLHKEQEEVKRRPFRMSKVLKVAMFCAVIAAIIWLGFLYPVHEKIGAKCFVAPRHSRVVTSRIAGEVEGVFFDQGDSVQKEELLIQLRTDQIEVALAKERENAKNIEARIDKLRGQVPEETSPEKRGQLLADIRASQHALEAKRQEIKLLNARLADCYLKAPISGTIIEPEDPDELRGVAVREGEPLCRVGDVGKEVKIRVAIPGRRVAETEPGQTVEVRLRPFIEQQVIEGTIENIAERSVTYKNANVFMADVIVPRRLEVKGEGSEGRIYSLNPGMTGKAKVVLRGKTNYASIYGGMIYRKVKYWLY